MEILTEMKSQRNIEIDREGETDSSLVRLELQRGEEDRQPLIKISHKLEPNAGVFTARSSIAFPPLLGSAYPTENTQIFQPKTDPTYYLFQLT